MFPWYSHVIPMMKYTISQWPFQEPKMEVPTIYKAYNPGIPIESVNQFPSYSHDVIRHNTPQKTCTAFRAAGLAYKSPWRVHSGYCETQWLMVLNSG